MALEVIGASKREFVIKQKNESVTIPDPNKDFSPEEVMKFMSHKHPELATATVSGPTINTEGVAIYEFKANIGTKG